MVEPFRRIVVAFDDSPQARLALDRAIDLARTWSARLIIVAVYPSPPTWVAGPMTGPMVAPEPSGPDERKALDEILQRAVRAAEERGVAEVTGRLLEGHPAEMILDAVDREHADLVVLGSRGQSTTSRLFLGSVSDAIVHHARVTVLIVRPPRPG